MREALLAEEIAISAISRAELRYGQRRVQPVVRARYAASGMLKSGSLAAYPE